MAAADAPEVEATEIDEHDNCLEHPLLGHEGLPGHVFPISAYQLLVGCADAHLHLSRYYFRAVPVVDVFLDFGGNT